LRIVFAGRRKHQQHRPSTFVSNILPLQISSVPPYPYRTPRISSTFIHNQVPVVSQSVTRSDPTRPFVHGSQIASYYHFTSTLYRLVIFTHEKRRMRCLCNGCEVAMVLKVVFSINRNG
jgi:hypothetical protein